MPATINLDRRAGEECAETASLGVGGSSCSVFRNQDEMASGAYAKRIVQSAGAIKKEVRAVVITDVCNCEYTSTALRQGGQRRCR